MKTIKDALIERAIEWVEIHYLDIDLDNSGKLLCENVNAYLEEMEEGELEQARR